MPKIRFHTLAAIVVLIVSAVWVLTGEFSSVGSAANEDDAAKPAEGAAKAEQAAATPALRTVAFVKPVFVDHNRTIRISGVTDAVKRTALATRTAGVVGKLAVKKGDRVKEGALVLELDVEDKAAAVETAKAVLDQRQNSFDAISRLVKRGSSAKSEADKARAELATARSQLELAQADLGRLQVKAPFAGIVDKVDVEQGSYVQPGATVATLLQLDPVVAKGEVSERDLGFVKEGGMAEVRLVSGVIAKGTISHISRESSAQTRTFPVEVEIANGDGAIPAGMTAEITLRADPVKSVVLPRSVVTLSGDGDLGVRILKPDGTVDFVGIDIIDDTPKGLILGGVPEDARIIVAGQDLVTEGEKVNAVEADAAMVKKLAGAETTGSVD
jgi:membrane fusion protein, multidrug efflux system